MKFMLLIRGEDKFRQLSPTEAQATLEKYFAWARKLREEGRMIDSDPLTGSGTILSGASGIVTDGPYVETKDTVGGYFIFTADSLDEATAICRECPALGYGGSVELRPIAVFE